MDLPLPLIGGALLFVWTVWAVLFWGAIRVIEPHNVYNTFRAALLWSTVELGVTYAAATLRGLVLLLAWLVFLVRLLLGRYELGVLHAIGVVLVTVAGPYLVTDSFLSFVDGSETKLLVALYGVPAVVWVVWLWPKRHRGAPSNLPEARVIEKEREVAVAPPPRPVVIARAPEVVVRSVDKPSILH